MERFGRCRQALLRADSADAVSNIINDCMSSLPPHMLARLPSSVQRILSRPVADIRGSAVELLHAELKDKTEPEEAILMREIAQTYATASVRLVQVSAGPGKPH